MREPQDAQPVTERTRVAWRRVWAIADDEVAEMRRRVVARIEAEGVGDTITPGEVVAILAEVMTSSMATTSGIAALRGAREMRRLIARHGPGVRRELARIHELATHYRLGDMDTSR